MLSPTRLRRFQALGIDPARDQDMAAMDYLASR
jgi:hypothetical protein